jgi:hypothetical protein
MAQFGINGLPAGATVTARAGQRIGGANGPFSAPETTVWPSEAPPTVDAHIIAQDEVINPEVLPLTASIGRFGNGYNFIGRDGAFEPAVFRHQFTPISGGANSCGLTPQTATKFDAWPDGLFTGGSASVYRITNGNMVLVRESTITAHRAKGYYNKSDSGKIVTTTTFRFKFENWSRNSVSAWFAVTAVTAAGAQSAPSTAVLYTTPATWSSPSTPTNTQVNKTLNGTTSGTAPTGLTVTAVGDGTMVDLAWDAVAGADGYIVYMSDHDPAGHTGYGLDFASDGGGAILAGDIVIARKKFYAPLRSEVVSNKLWKLDQEYFNFSIQNVKKNTTTVYPGESASETFELVAHPGTKPFADAGETFIRLTLSGSSQIRIGESCHGSTNQTSLDFYQVLDPAKTYRVSVWMKADASRNVVFNPGMFLANGSSQGLTTTFAVTTSWQLFTWDFSPAEVYTTGSTIGEMRLEFPTTGVFDVDNFRVFEAGTPYLGLTPEWEARVLDAELGALRTHVFIKTGQRTYDVEQYTNPPGVISSSGGGGSTLPQLLQIAKQVGTLIWPQCEYHFSESEILALVEYLAGTTGPYADKRIAQGQTAPWTDEFDVIYWEFANETWNLLFAPWIFGAMTDSATAQVYTSGAVYGKMQEYLIGVMKSSPHWTPALTAKFKFLLGGWAGQSYSTDAAAASPNSQVITIAAYNGGWEAGGAAPLPGIGTSYRQTLTYVEQGAQPSVDLLVANANGLEAGTYEAGPGYLLSGLNGATVTTEQANGQERVMKSVSGGVATLDVFLQNMQKGLTIQNYFTLSQGQRWTSHAFWHRGGSAFPAWQALAMFNKEAGGGDMLRTRVLWKPTSDLPAVINPNNSQTVYAAKDDAADVSAYSFRRGSRVALFLISRLLPFDQLDVADDLYDAADDGYRTFWCKVPVPSATSLKLYKFDQGYDKHNVTAPTGGDTRAAVITITETSLTVPARPNEFLLDASMGATGGLPPASVFLYVWDGVPT